MILLLYIHMPLYMSLSVLNHKDKKDNNNSVSWLIFKCQLKCRRILSQYINILCQKALYFARTFYYFCGRASVFIFWLIDRPKLVALNKLSNLFQIIQTLQIKSEGVSVSKWYENSCLKRHNIITFEICNKKCTKTYFIVLRNTKRS